MHSSRLSNKELYWWQNHREIVINKIQTSKIYIFTPSTARVLSPEHIFKSQRTNPILHTFHIVSAKYILLEMIKWCVKSFVVVVVKKKKKGWLWPVSLYVDRKRVTQLQVLLVWLNLDSVPILSMRCCFVIVAVVCVFLSVCYCHGKFLFK